MRIWESRGGEKGEEGKSAARLGVGNRLCAAVIGQAKLHNVCAQITYSNFIERGPCACISYCPLRSATDRALLPWNHSHCSHSCLAAKYTPVICVSISTCIAGALPLIAPPFWHSEEYDVISCFRFLQIEIKGAQPHRGAIWKCKTCISTQVSRLTCTFHPIASTPHRPASTVNQYHHKDPPNSTLSE